MPTLPLILAASKYFRLNFRLCLSFYPCPNIPDIFLSQKWKIPISNFPLQLPHSALGQKLSIFFMRDRRHMRCSHFHSLYLDQINLLEGPKKHVAATLTFLFGWGFPIYMNIPPTNSQHAFSGKVWGQPFWHVCCGVWLVSPAKQVTRNGCRCHCYYCVHNHPPLSTTIMHSISMHY